MNIKSRKKSDAAGHCSDFVVRLGGGDSSSVTGKIEHVQSGEIEYFEDFLEMLLLIQAKLDEKDYPQCDTELRSFYKENQISGGGNGFQTR